MKLCFILEYYHPHTGGAEYLFKNLTEGLCRAGHSVTVLTRRIAGTAPIETLNGVRIVRARTINRYLFTFLSIPRALALTKDCDIVHTTTYNGAFPAWLAAKWRRIPAVITVLEVWIDQWRKLTEMSAASAAAHNLLEKMIYRLKFDFYIAISQYTARQLEAAGVETAATRTIYHGFDYDDFRAERYDGVHIREKYGLQDAFLCFSWGRPGVSKGHEYLIQAVPRIVEKIPHARFLLMLSARETHLRRYQYLKRLIEKLDIGKWISLIDPAPRGELGHFLKAADCVIIPSVAEGFGYAVLEACAMGRPVVASDTTSIPEVIGGRYVLVEPKNPEAIAAGVVSVFQNKYTTSALKIFPWETTVSEYAAIYTKIVTRPGR